MHLYVVAHKVVHKKSKMTFEEKAKTDIFVAASCQ